MQAVRVIVPCASRATSASSGVLPYLQSNPRYGDGTWASRGIDASCNTDSSTLSGGSREHAGERGSFQTPRVDRSVEDVSAGSICSNAPETLLLRHAEPQSCVTRVVEDVRGSDEVVGSSHAVQ